MVEQPRKVGVYDRIRDTATHRRGRRSVLGLDRGRPLDPRSRGVVVLGLQPIGHSNDTARRTHHWGGNRRNAGPDTSAASTAAIRHKLFRNRCTAQPGAA
jgi:hypothetical protein